MDLDISSKISVHKQSAHSTDNLKQKCKLFHCLSEALTLKPVYNILNEYVILYGS